MAKLYGVRPSSFIKGLSGYVAYCLDEAVMIYNFYLEQGRKPLEWEEKENQL
jgi:hypothetical protein